MPAFDGLFPDPYNHLIQNLLFTLTYWHGLAKLRLHTDRTLDLLEEATESLGRHLRQFVNQVCHKVKTYETAKEASARTQRQTRAREKAKVNKGKTVTTKGKGKDRDKDRSTRKGKNNGATLTSPSPMQETKDAPNNPKRRRQRSFNLLTYKIHALGDYVWTIHSFGTTDSYSTQQVRI
jgi:hypothetical protein